MPGPLSTGAFFNAYHHKLALQWLAGRAGEHRPIRISDPQSNITIPTGALIGHLNLVHPNRIQVLGGTELNYLGNLGKNSYHDAIAQLFDNKPAFVVIADDKESTEDLKQAAEDSGTPLFSSSLPGHKLISYMQYYLSNMLAERQIVHGVFMEVLGIGVLITGKSGVGKSELALELITRGHRLIADDAPEFSRISPDTLNGVCPSALSGFLEVRGLGILNIRSMFGDSAIKQNRHLRLIVHLLHMDDKELCEIDRLQGSRQSTTILEIEIPRIILPVAPGRNLAVLLEGAVRSHILHIKGYDAAQDFIALQQRLISEGD